MKPEEMKEVLMDAFPSDTGSFTFLRVSQNLVYEFADLDGVPRILRLTPGEHRSLEEIEDELEWVCDLRRAGLNVCAPVPLGGDELIRQVPGLPGYLAVVFEKARGGTVVHGDLDSALYRAHGRQMALLHEQAGLSREGMLSRRRAWHEERYFTRDIEAFLPADKHEAMRCHFNLLMRELGGMPVTKKEHGPVHFDLGYSNFFLQRDCVEVFDFDNCVIGPFAGDVAAALYGSIFTGARRGSAGDRSVFETPKTGQTLEEVWAPFKSGYESARPWPGRWAHELPLWMEILYFRSVVHAFRMQHPLTNPKAMALLDADIENLLGRKPAINFDYVRGRATGR